MGMTSTFAVDGRVSVAGQQLVLRDSTYRVRGVTYGSFLPRADGARFPEPDRIDADFAHMAEAGFNTVRIYSSPPADLLAAAGDHGLRLIVGVHYDDWRMESSGGRSASRRVLDHGRRALDECLELCGRSASVLAISVGNEVPADLVRLHGVHRVSGVLGDLVEHVHRADPSMLVTYTNFPTTEFLEIDGLDLVTFNVFLEDRGAFRRYLRHLQVLAMDQPLVLTELGASAVVHGESGQSAMLAWQLEEVASSGIAGATVFSWTDEWGVGDVPVEGWGFGVTTAERRPKPSLSAVRRGFEMDVRDVRDVWPTISVVVCAYNEERHIADCLKSLTTMDYPGLEVILCDDGSTDATSSIALGFPVTVLELPHGGLSAARNAGLAAAKGEIVAYLDADAEATRDWLYHIAQAFEGQGIAAAGGPNLPALDPVETERAVARCPGNPREVLITDTRAEHLAGCNMAFLRDELLAVGGFDVGYTSAGDDVDVCWKVIDRDREIAFSPAAVVHHHRRGTARGFLRQQRGYGRAERLLSGPHRHRINRLGQARWSGFVYGSIGLPRWLLRPTVYHGWGGTSPFQPTSRRRHKESLGYALAVLPFWVLVGLLSVLPVALSPWLLALPLLASAGVGALAVSIFTGARPPRDIQRRLRFRALVTWLHLAAPFVRLVGRLESRPLPRPRESDDVQEWHGDRDRWREAVMLGLQRARCGVRVGGVTAQHDLEVRRGPFLVAHINLAVVWSWMPRHKIRLRPRSARLLAALAGIAACVALAPGTWTAVAATLLVIAVAGEAWMLRAVVEGVVSTSTRSAGAPGSWPASGVTGGRVLALSEGDDCAA